MVGIARWKGNEQMSCLECGEYMTNPNQWVCDKCSEKFMIPFNKLSEEDKKKVLKGIEKTRRFL